MAGTSAAWTIELGERLQLIRLYSGSSLDDFGKSLPIPVSGQTVRRWEAGHRPSEQSLPAVLKVIRNGLSEDVLDGGDTTGIRVSFAGGGMVCEGMRWVVLDRPRLVKHLALLAQGRHAWVRQVLEACAPKLAKPRTREGLLRLAIRKLEEPPTQALRYHRDGWVFQMISWIVAHRTSPPRAIIRALQQRKADKGFDGLMVCVADSGDAVEGVTISEDKATENPRSTITDEVWPEITALEADERADELENETTALLDVLGKDEALALAEAIHWKDARRYRVCSTASGAPEHLPAQLYKGFDGCAPGVLARRRGEVLDLGVSVGALRAWMTALCKDVIAELSAQLPSPKVGDAHV